MLHTAAMAAFESFFFDLRGDLGFEYLRPLFCLVNLYGLLLA